MDNLSVHGPTRGAAVGLGVEADPGLGVGVCPDLGVGVGIVAEALSQN